MTSVERVARLSSAVSSSSARSSGESCDAGGAQSADGRHRGRERATEIMAHRGQQCGAHLVGLGEDTGLARGLGELEVLESRSELGDDHVQEAAFRGIQLAAVQLERRPRRVLGADPEPDHAAVRHRLAVRREDGPIGREEANPGHAERLARAADEGGDGALAAQHAAGDGGQQLRLGGCPLRHAGAACGLIDDVAHEDRDDHVQHERERMQRVGDRHGEQRLDEQEVEGEPRKHGREQRRPDAADQRDDDDEQLVGEDVRGDRLLAAAC